ncbi:FAD-dependent oxidoreductase, partial [Brevibacterium sp.]|uniref:NAD(P)/FAD-dependent oxidoreductase n=1 Tax=Brevibacterium sp. TaxID=1701 RepID=UPI002811A983
MRTAIIIGGGVLGSALFRDLGRRGVSVRLADAPGVASSFHSFSWINAAARTDPDYYALRLQGMVRHLLHSVPLGLARFGGVLSWDGRGRIEPVQGAKEAETVVSAHRRLIDAGHLSELLDRAGALDVDRSLNPAALPDEGIQFSGDEGWVDLPGLVRHLRSAGVRAGGTVFRGEVRPSLSPAGDRVDGVILPDGGRVAADAVIVAAGADTYRILAEAGLAVPDDNSVGVIARSRPIDHRRPTAIVRSPDVCVRPGSRDTVTFHSTVAEEGLGPVDEVSEEQLTAGASAMLEHVRHLYDAPEIELDRAVVVRRPVPGDGLPVVGQAGVANLHVLASHSGATVALVLAEMLGRELVTGVESALLARFRP